MNKETIGTNAGLVWSALSSGEKLSLKGLKKATRLKDKELYAALGWLAREDKVTLDNVDDEVIVGLNC